ncbi:GntR family transcriptional regulator [Gemmatimonadota bacterium]
MHMHIETGSEIPIYQQISHSVRRSIAIGSIRKGEQIPSVREVAGQLNVNPNTVLRAYRVLEEEGIIVMKTGVGTYLVNSRASDRMQECLDHLVRIIDRALTEARLLLMDRDQIQILFDTCLHRIYRDGK